MRRRSHNKRAKELDPLTPYLRSDLGLVYNHARRYDEAIAECDQNPEIDPKFAYTYWCLGFAYWQKGMLEEAVTVYECGVELSPEHLQVKTDLAIVYAAARQKAQAQKILEEVEEKARREYVPPPYALAMANMPVGNGTFGWLDKLYEERSPWLIWMNVQPRHDRLRGDPRFQQLLSKIGFTEAQIDEADAIAGERGEHRRPRASRPGALVRRKPTVDRRGLGCLVIGGRSV